MERPPTIRGIFFSEFDNVLGPVIRNIVGKWGNADSKKELERNFEVISEYVITKPALAGKLITLCAFGYKLMGVPMCIEGEKYPRNALLFNLCFLFDMDADVTPFEPIVRKLAKMLRTLEEESGFLFGNPNRKDKLDILLPTIFGELNHYGECSLLVDDANAVNLKLFPQLKAPPVVLDHEVPVLLHELKPQDVEEWEMTVRQIIPYIDGVRYVKRIARELDMDINIAKEALRHLLYYNCIKMVDVFQYTNMYTCTGQIGDFAKDRVMQKNCVSYVAIPDCPAPSLSKVFNLYCSLRAGMQFQPFCSNFDLAGNNIDERRFITFGTVHGFIRRIHKYPLYMSLSTPTEYDVSEITPRNFPIKLFRYLNGKRNFDEICAQENKSYLELDAMLRADKKVIAVFK